MDNPISRSISHLAELVQDLPDADLEKDWAWGSYKSEGIRFAYFRTYEDLRQLAVQINHARAASGTQAQRILTQYHAAYLDLQGILLGVDSKYFEMPPADGEWSLRRTYAHIVGADLGFYVAIKFALERYRQDKDPFVEIDDDTWLGVAGMDESELDSKMDEPLPGLRAFHKDLHMRILLEFAEMDASELEKASRFWEDEYHTLRFRLHRFDAHMRQHTIQIEKTLQAIGHVPNESQRLMRLIYSALAEVEGVLLGAGNVYEDILGEVGAQIEARNLEIESVISG